MKSLPSITLVGMDVVVVEGKVVVGVVEEIKGKVVVVVEVEVVMVVVVVVIVVVVVKVEVEVAVVVVSWLGVTLMILGVGVELVRMVELLNHLNKFCYIH